MPPPNGPEPRRTAAALVLLYPDDSGETLVLLTERSAGEFRHSGEISFPGGVVDPSDASPIEAALREAREEVGLDLGRAGVEVVGVLDAVYIRVSGFVLVPVLAVAHRRPALHADPREVAAILEVPVRLFVPPAPIQPGSRERAGRSLRFGGYPLPHLVWGATGRVLGQLGAILSTRAA